MSTGKAKEKSEDRNRQAEARRQARRLRAAQADPGHPLPEEEADTSDDEGTG